MSFVSLLILAVGLAMDATAVAAALGLVARRVGVREVASVALWFGAFQGLMPVAGWFLGRSVGPWLDRWDHWVAFGLLVAIGAKMLWEARKDAAEHEVASDKDAFRAAAMVVMAVATSIDAFAVGITLPALGVDVDRAALTIGVTTAILSALGVIVGRRLGKGLGRRLDVIGGLVLIGLGVKILSQHYLR